MFVLLENSRQRLSFPRMKCLSCLQAELFDKFLHGSTLEECYSAVASVANRWLDLLDVCQCLMYCVIAIALFRIFPSMYLRDFCCHIVLLKDVKSCWLSADSKRCLFKISLFFITHSLRIKERMLQTVSCLNIYQSQAQ